MPAYRSTEEVPRSVKQPAHADVSSPGESIAGAVSLVVPVARRLALAADVAAAKFISGGQVDDPVRESEIVDWVADKLVGRSPGRELAVAFFRDQIMANKIVQRGLHSYWRSHPADFPAAWRSLTDEIRPQLDVINGHLLSLLACVGQVSADQLVAVADLLDARLSVSPVLSPIGDVRRAAARTALRSLSSSA